MNFRAFVFAVTCTLMYVGGTEALAETESESALHNKTGINLIKQKQYGEALKEFKIAAEKAAPNSADELSARQNIVAACESIGDANEVWNAKRAVYVLENKISGQPIPEEFNGATPIEAKENKLLKDFERAKNNQAGKDSAKHFWDTGFQLVEIYDQQNAQEKAAAIFQVMEQNAPADTVKQTAFYHLWADWYKKHGKEAQATECERKIAVIVNRNKGLEKQHLEQAKQKQEQFRAQEEQHYQYILSHQEPDPGTFEENMAGKLANVSIQTARATLKAIPDIPKYRAAVNATSGATQIVLKAEAVEHLDKIKTNLDECYRAGVSLSSYPNWRNVARYLFQYCYVGYRALDKNDPRLPQIYQTFVSLRQADAQDIIKQAERYK